MPPSSTRWLWHFCTCLRQSVHPSKALLLRVSLFLVCTCTGIFAQELQSNPSIGNFTALLVLVQFPEHSDRILPNPSYFRTLCATKIIPYLRDQSYGQYNIECDVQDWRMTNQSQTYFAAGIQNEKGPDRSIDFAVPVLDQLDADPGMDWDRYDVDHDGYIDAILFIHSGWSFEMDAGTACQAESWNQRLRSHAFATSTNSWRGQSKRVSGYATVSALRNVCDVTPAQMDVITHEWMHTLAAIDLYDIGEMVWTIPGGLGSFDLMANADGPRYDGKPGSLSPYNKMLIGWLEPIEIIVDGTYTIQTSSRYPQVYIIRKGYGVGEYLLIENRYIVDWDAVLPGNGGLLVYHVDEEMMYQDRPGWPESPFWPNDHYLVALLQADGNYDLEQGRNNGDSGDYFTANTPPLLPGGRGNFPNTDAYQFGELIPTGISVSDISIPGETMTFKVTGVGAATETPTSAPTKQKGPPQPISVSDPGSLEDLGNDKPFTSGAGGGNVLGHMYWCLTAFLTYMWLWTNP